MTPDPVTVFTDATGEVENPAPRVLRLLAGSLAWVAGIGIIALMLLAVVEIARREMTGKGFQFTLEFTEVALVAVVFAGMASACLSGSHVSTPLLTQRLPPVPRHVVRMVGSIVAVALLVWLIVVSTDEAIHSYQVGEVRFGLSRIQVWPAKASIPVGLVVFALVLVHHTIGIGCRLRGSVRGDRQ